MRMRARLDSDSQASLITDVKTKALMIPIVKVETPIAALGSAKTQKTQVKIVMKNNEAVETNLHPIAKWNCHPRITLWLKILRSCSEFRIRKQISNHRQCCIIFNLKQFRARNFKIWELGSAPDKKHISQKKGNAKVTLIEQQSKRPTTSLLFNCFST